MLLKCKQLGMYRKIIYFKIEYKNNNQRNIKYSKIGSLTQRFIDEISFLEI